MAKTLAVIFGIILVLLGLLGFVSNPLIGSGALFATDAVLNVLNLILGVILLVVAFYRSGASALWLKILGAVIFLWGLIGILTVPASGGVVLGVAAVNGATNWLDLIFGVIIFITGMYGSDSAPASMPPAQSANPQV